MQKAITSVRLIPVFLSKNNASYDTLLQNLFSTLNAVSIICTERYMRAENEPCELLCDTLQRLLNIDAVPDPCVRGHVLIIKNKGTAR